MLPTEDLFVYVYVRIGDAIACGATEAELRHLFPLYLHAVRTGLPPTDERFNEGIKWATDPVASQVALLRPVGPSQGMSRWIIFDYVVTADEGDGSYDRPIPAELWNELIEIIPARDTLALGIAPEHVARPQRRSLHSVRAPLLVCRTPAQRLPLTSELFSGNREIWKVREQPSNLRSTLAILTRPRLQQFSSGCCWQVRMRGQVLHDDANAGDLAEPEDRQEAGGDRHRGHQQQDQGPTRSRT